MPNNNPWSFWLEDFPEALYGAMIPKGTPSFMDYWQGQRGNVWQQYQTALGQQALGGQPPSLGFRSFLEDYPFLQRWSLMSPQRRGYRSFMPGLSWRI